MRKDLVNFNRIYSSFLSSDADVLKILKTLFITSKPYSDILKRLLVINNKDCLDVSNVDYKKVIDNYSLGDLMEKGYVRLSPKIQRGTHQEIKTYVLVSLDSFSPNSVSPKYIDYNISFDIICYNDAWVLDDYKIRPLTICGYIDGILNSLTNQDKIFDKSHQSNIKLSGIGEYKFLGCNYSILNQDLGMYSLTYRGIHFTEDIKQISNDK